MMLTHQIKLLRTGSGFSRTGDLNRERLQSPLDSNVVDDGPEGVPQ